MTVNFSAILELAVLMLQCEQMTCSKNSADIFLCLSLYYHFYLLLDNPFDNNDLKSAVSFSPQTYFQASSFFFFMY